MRVFLGFDTREPLAYEVASSSLLRTSGIRAEELNEQALRVRGLLTRPVDRRGRMHDLVSNADQSTEFAISRFLVPILCSTGWVLFADSDVVFLRDVRKLMQRADPTKAVMVVKHQHQPSTQWKMDGQAQAAYPRKNWSSVILWNIEHPANRRLSLHDVNTRPGRDLHAFYWLNDAEIGELPAEWNWLVREQTMPANPAIAHFTLGGPFTAGWKGAEHDEIWHRAHEQMLTEHASKEAP